MPYPKIPAEVRFLDRYEIDKSGCWLWTGSTVHPDSYGTFQITKQKRVFAHRFSFEVFKGPIPPGLFVLHMCDTPRCVNPDHLYVGTSFDNMRDMVSRGRGRSGVKPMPGEHNGRAKLSERDVRYIRSVPVVFGTKLILAQKFGVHPSTIKKIMDRKLWPHLP